MDQLTHRIINHYFIDMTKQKSTTLFEDSLDELEVIVEQLEHDNVALEESLKSFEQDVKLTPTYQTVSKEAEQKRPYFFRKKRITHFGAIRR